MYVCVYDINYANKTLSLCMYFIIHRSVRMLLLFRFSLSDTVVWILCVEVVYSTRQRGYGEAAVSQRGRSWN